jgi:putative colanic acid biosysnthesis UDP-glucose lipid carrier transferase
MASLGLVETLEDDAAVNVAPLRRVHAQAAFRYRVVEAPIGGALKRSFDVVAAGVGLIALSPLFALVCVLIALDSPGPVCFYQRRSGFRGKAFSIVKFRTMTTMEHGSSLTQARPGDARVTRVGRLLRRTSIDELPQLINVLLGHMSLVGPRPHAVMHDRQFFLVDHRYPERFRARPGITGFAQVSGARGVTETAEQIERRLELDLDYLERWSFLRDLGILCRTARVVLGDRQAC